MTTKFNFSLLGRFGQSMYDTLLYKHHLQRKTAKEVEFKDSDEAIQGYIIDKEHKRYLLPLKDHNSEIDNITKFPVRVLKSARVTARNSDIMSLITEYRSFKVTPEKIYSMKQLIDVDEIKHESIIDWTLWKIVVIACRLARANIRVSAVRRFGKTSYIDIVNYLLDKASVINRPRSVPGICIHINPDGLIALDEMGQLPSDIKREVQSILFQCGNFGNYVSLGSAGSMAHKTKPRYDVRNMSCINIYNRVEDYAKREHFFDYMFSNSQAINDRFLPLRPDDAYLDMNQFADSQTMKLTKETKDMFIGIMKSAEYYRQEWTHLVDHKRVNESLMRFEEDIKGRHKISFKTIANFIWLYADDDYGVYQMYLERLHKWFTNYNDALKKREDLVYD